MRGTRTTLRDEATSPVIAVILMVAITVVLAATVYAWTSGFGASGDDGARTVSLVGDGALAPAAGGDNPRKTFLVAAATPGLRWADLALHLDGARLAHDATLLDGAPDANAYCILTAAGACEADPAAAGAVDAGDRVRVEDATLAGSTLLLLDADANRVLLTLSIQ